MLVSRRNHRVRRHLPFEGYLELEQPIEPFLRLPHPKNHIVELCARSCFDTIEAGAWISLGRCRQVSSREISMSWHGLRVASFDAGYDLAISEM
jgi:hypothetical protein